MQSFAMDAFSALADPTRRGILELLGRGERAAGAIAEHLAMSAPATSQHLKVLREAGLVRARVDGQFRIYSVDPEGWAEIDHWFRRVRRYWPDRLDALERALGQADGEPTKGGEHE